MCVHTYIRVPTIMENQMEKNIMKNDMETGYREDYRG